MLDLKPIERRAMQMLLAGDHPKLESLRQQFESCCVTARDYTGLGFFTSFGVRDGSPRLEPPSRIVIGDVCADVDGLEYGCGFILFVEGGIVDTLECHLWGDSGLPEDARYTRLYYVHQPSPPSVTETKQRDAEAVIALLGR